MIFHFFIFNLILNICNAQEHLTYLRTNDVLTLQPTVSTRIQQGSPGKRGPIGLKGDTGSKGNKGDPRILDQTSINALRIPDQTSNTEIPDQTSINAFHRIACVAPLSKPQTMY